MSKLLAAAGVHGLTVSEANGYGRQRATPRFTVAPNTPCISFRKIRIACFSPTDADAETLVGAIVKSAGSGTIGDGKVCGSLDFADPRAHRRRNRKFRRHPITQTSMPRRGWTA